MFKDTEKELRRLEAELLAEEEEYDQEQDWEEDWEEGSEDEDLLTDRELDVLLEDTRVIGTAPVYQNHANNYGNRVYNADRLEQDVQDFSDELLEQPQERRSAGLVLLACLLAVGILCVAVWWVARYWRVL